MTTVDSVSPLRLNAALQEARLNARVDSALLSSLPGPGSVHYPAHSPLRLLSAGESGAPIFPSPRAALTTAEDILNAASAAPPSIRSRIAYDAYLLEAQAQQAIEQRALMNATSRHEWFG